MTDSVVSQVSAGALRSGNVAARVSQASVAVLRSAADSGVVDLRLSQASMMVLRSRAGYVEQPVDPLPRPGASLSDAIQEAYASAPCDVVILHTIELNHPAFEHPVRVVRDHQNLTANLENGDEVEFVALAFDFTLPPESETGGVPEIVVSVDNVSRLLAPYLDQAVQSLDPVTMTYRPYLSTDLTAPHMDPPLTLTLKNITVTPLRVTARATFSDLSNRRFPGEDYSSINFPGLVAR